jgi:hypothetical protein
LIRQWVETRISGINERFAQGVERSGFTATVKNNWIEFAYIVGIIVMSAGIVSALAEPVDQAYLIYPSTNGQTIAETALNSMALAMGFLGLYFSYLSGRQTVRPRLVGFYLVVGLLLITGAIYLETYIYISK